MKKICILFLVLISIVQMKSFAQLVASVTNPTNCNGSDGEIKLSGNGIGLNTKFVFGYKYKKSDILSSDTVKSDKNGMIAIKNLAAGVYYNFFITPLNTKDTIKYNKNIVLNDGCHLTTHTRMPTTSLATDGAILIEGLTPNSLCSINYTIVDREKVSKMIYNDSIKSDASGTVTISNLSEGDYSNFTINNSEANLDTIQIRDQTGYIAVNNNVQWSVSMFQNIVGVLDDNTSTFNELYGSISIPVSHKKGIISNASSNERLIGLRNVYVQGNYSSNVGNLNSLYQDTIITKKTVRYINELDALRYANTRLLLNVNLLTYILPEYKNYGVIGHLYIDGILGLIETSISDSILQKTFPVTSLAYGFNFRVKSKNLKIADINVPLGFEFGTQIFWINTYSNDVNAQMNEQYSNYIRNTSKNINNSSKQNITSMQPYYHFDMLLYYNTGKSNDSISSSNIYFHASYYSNLVNPNANSSVHTNSYLQFQLGYALSINKLISILNKK